MSGIAARIRTAQDKDGMLRRALERIIQLYTDKSHFVYELLQNAEDAEAASVKFVQYADRLEVFHDGRPFTPENLQGLCDIGRSDKTDNLNQIGEFGVGFKSVFGICDTVKLFSNPSHYRKPTTEGVFPFAVEILDFTRPEDIEGIKLPSDYTTKFVFPYTTGRTFSGFQTIAELNRTLSKKLQNLGITTLLFMKNLELIEYQICLGDKPIEGEYLLDKRPVNDHCSLVSALGRSVADETQVGKDEEISYLMFSRPIRTDSPRSVDIAFPITINKEGQYQCQKPKSPYVSVYFPTETESKLDFIVQGPYRTTPNRSSIPEEDADNQALADMTAELLKDSILELKDAGKLNMSFVKALPISEYRFDNFELFRPLYGTIRDLFSTDVIIPCKNSGYVAARNAKIARQERLSTLLPDELLSSLFNDKHAYRWLPTFLTETNREYEQVYRYLTGELEIDVIRPEDLRLLFASNPTFLPQRDDSWLVELYSILENIGAAFSKSRNETNMLTANIVKTSTGEFVAPFRKTESKQYIPNIFLPSQKIKTADIHFVDSGIYEKCRHFFDDILGLEEPNEYEFIIRDIKKRYDGQSKTGADKHIEDIHNILKYLKYDEYHDEVSKIIKEQLSLKCSDGIMRNPNAISIYLPVSKDGISIEGYYRNIRDSINFIDIDFYSIHNVSMEDLCNLGVRDSILIGTEQKRGIYDNGMRGRKPEWWTSGEYRWKLSMDAVKDVLKYISEHPNAKDSILKSQAIFRLLLLNVARLSGTVYVGGNTPHLRDEPCEIIRILRGERASGWNGKWLYIESGELVSQKAASKHDLSIPIYGRPVADSPIYELLGFRKTDADEIDDLKKTIPAKQLDAFFENELRLRFGITSADLRGVYEAPESHTQNGIAEAQYPFPVVKVKSWAALQKHAAEMLCYANPVKYEYLVRSVRTSRPNSEVRAYLMNMYRYDGVYKYACQMCHEASATIEAVQIFDKPEAELDPMNLCLCPTCASRYRTLRNNNGIMDVLRRSLISAVEEEITNGKHVEINIGEDELWFTQTHFAEIHELLKLTEEIKKNGSAQTAKSAKSSISPVEDTADQSKSGLDVYQAYIGKRVRHRVSKFNGKVIACDGLYISVLAEDGEKRGSTIKYNLSKCLQGKLLEILD